MWTYFCKKDSSMTILLAWRVWWWCLHCISLYQMPVRPQFYILTHILESLVIINSGYSFIKMNLLNLFVLLFFFFLAFISGYSIFCILLFYGIVFLFHCILFIIILATYPTANVLLSSKVLFFYGIPLISYYIVSLSWITFYLN